MMVQGARLTRCCGLELQRPVIPPLLGVGGVRCSVKPASRYTLLSRRHKTCAFAQVPWLNSQLGAGRPAWCTHQSNLLSQSHVPSPWCPHLGHKLVLFSSANIPECETIINTYFCHILADVGLNGFKFV
ncbi:hypothetical protein QL285_023161 [Trifolium repens]|nr:hypothetical protein QL285_023161 [Trifolium repens]